MEPIRILQVLASLDRGGTETMIMNVYRKIDKSKVQFDFIVNEQEEEYAYESEIKELGGRIFRIPRYTIFNHLMYKQIWKGILLKHPEWTVIHGHHTSSAFVYFKIAKSLDRIIIAHSHTSGGEVTVKSLFKVLMRYPLRYQADYLFACSKQAAEWMYGDCSSSTQIINNAIDAKSFSFNEAIRNEKRKELGIENKFVLGHVGRFQPVKNHEFLIDIFKDVYVKDNNSILLLVGDGELRNSVEQKVNRLGLADSVIFTGVRSDVSELLQVMDVFVFPSLFEGLGLVLVEAQATGLKCIVSDIIPKEARVTNLIEAVSLKKPIDNWGDKILNLNVGYERTNIYEQIKSKGYDIYDTANWLETFYLEAYYKLKRDGA